MNELEPEWAHSPNETGRPEPLLEHLELVAHFCESFAGRFRAGSWGRLAGLWHDVGKFPREFQAYIRGFTPGVNIDHSTAGAQYVYKVGGDVGKILAYTIAGHHGGLPDYHGGLDERLTKAIPEWLPYAPNELMGLKIEQCLPFALDPEDVLFQISFLIRMLYSALVDADYLATEQFMASSRSRQREVGASVCELGNTLERHMAQISNDRTDVNRRRREILASCVAAAAWLPGLFSLTVPTGGGKTLASLMFALKHALAHGMERVIVVVPYTSIIEQTADIYRQLFQEFGAATVIEHHSSFDLDNAPLAVRLATENWDGSIIITTAVQFFDSLFANRPGQCRKLHRLAKSVIILDEAQTLPVGLLGPCLSTLRVLVRDYQTSIVLCTATQPALNKRPDFPTGLKDVREIIPSPAELYESMRRVRVSYAGSLPNNELVKRLGARKQVLCIVNTTRHAALLAAAIPGSYHLSARMCPVHRLAVLAEIKRRLKSGKICRVISTPVIEAGVDIDFPCVYRAMAGLDQIAQAAGRCNREGLAESGEVVVFEPEESFPPGHAPGQSQGLKSAAWSIASTARNSSVVSKLSCSFSKACPSTAPKEVLTILPIRSPVSLGS